MKTKVIFIACALVAASASVFAECYSEGIRVGNVQKFSVKGYVNKSWEGELVMEGEKISGNAQRIKGGNVWKFSVLDPAVAKVIENSTMTGANIALKYCQVSPISNVTNFSTETPYHITHAVERK